MISTRRYLEALRQGDREARQIASADIDRRLEAMNELRAQIESERSHYLDRGTYEARHQLLETQLDASDHRVGALEATLANIQGRMAIVGGAFALLSAVLGAVALKLLGG